MKLVSVEFVTEPKHTRNAFMAQFVVDFKVGRGGDTYVPFEPIKSYDGGGTVIHHIDAFMFCVLGSK